MTRGIRCPLRKVGSRFKSSTGDWVTIVKDVDYKLVEVVFDSGTCGNLAYHHLKTGAFRDWMKPTLHGVGYLGCQRIVGEGDSRVYSRWNALITRCYSGEFVNYIDVKVDEEWHCYNNFRNWLASQPMGREAKWQVDKDLLGGRVYSSSNCVLLPQELNIIISTPPERYLPTGVIKTSSGEYLAQISYGGKLNRFIGKYPDIETASIKYKEVKEMRVKELADKWKTQLEDRAYFALINWKCGGVL